MEAVLDIAAKNYSPASGEVLARSFLSGRIIESGWHEERVARDGTYAELFALQATAYA